MSTKSLRLLFFLISMFVVGGCPAYSAQFGDPGFTQFKNGHDVKWPVNSPQFALLIGNNNYEKIGPDTHGNQPLGHLGSPCGDAKLVAEKLAHLKWKKNQIAVLCDQSKSDISDALDALIAAPLSSTDHPPLVFLYVSGHGTQVNRHSYFFGVNARPDYAKWSKFYLYQSLTGQPDSLLFSEDAIDIVAYVENAWGQNIQFPAVVMLDDCRDNGMAQDFARAINAELAKRSNRFVQGLPAILLGAPQQADAFPGGMALLYATRDGYTVQDGGAGSNSRLASGFAGNLVAGKDVSLILRHTQDAIDRDNTKYNLQEREYPQLFDRIFMDADDRKPCFAGCAFLKQSALTPLFGDVKFASNQFESFETIADNFHRSTIATDASPSGTNLREEQQVHSHAISRPQTQIVYQSAPGLSRNMTVETFWCDGTSENQDHYLLAKAFTNDLVSRVQSGAAQVARENIKTIRLSRISASLNSRPRYQHYRNAIILKEESELQRDVALSIVGGSFPKSKYHFDLVRNQNVPEQYLSVYFCKGAYSGPRAPVLYVRVANATYLPAGNQISSGLTSTYPDINIASGAKISFYGAPKLTEVRYFDESLKPIAEDVARRVAGNLHLANVAVVPKLDGTEPRGMRLTVLIGTTDYIPRAVKF